MSKGFVGPRRPDPSGKYESRWGDLRDVGASAIGGAAGGPWSWLIPILVALIPSLFGGEEDEEREAMKRAAEAKRIAEGMGLTPPYQSPYLPGIDKTVMQALLNNLQRTSNWGWPAGKQMDTSFIEQALSSLPSLPQLGTGAGGGSMSPFKIGRGQLRRP